MTTDNAPSAAPVQRLVGQRLSERIPRVGRLVIVYDSKDDDIFAARCVLAGEYSTTVYWVVAGTNGGKVRRANPQHDVWCFCPEIELPNSAMDGQPSPQK